MFKKLLVINFVCCSFVAQGAQAPETPARNHRPRATHHRVVRVENNQRPNQYDQFGPGLNLLPDFNFPHLNNAAPLNQFAVNQLAAQLQGTILGDNNNPGNRPQQ